MVGDDKSSNQLVGTVLILLLMLVVGSVSFYLGTHWTSSRQGGGSSGVLSGGGTEEGQAMVHPGLSGDAQYDGVQRLDLSVANGTVDCEEDDLPAGEVRLSWRYESKARRDIDEGDVELKAQLADGVLHIEDWRNKQAGKLGNINIHLELKHGPGVEWLDASHGNGTFCYDGSAARCISLGNGTLALEGQPAGDAKVSVGNGTLEADWLVAQGQHQLSVGNGTIDLGLREGSSLAVDASTGIGGISAPAGINVRRTGLLGATAHGSINGTAAGIDLSVGNGSVDIHQ